MMTTKLLALAEEAKKYIGVREVGGSNRGPDVEMFQRAVDGKACGEPYCVGFAIHCIDQVDSRQKGKPTTLFRSESGMILWEKSPMIQKITVPLPGCLMVWQMYEQHHFTKLWDPTRKSHVGIVTKVVYDRDEKVSHVKTVEGNTSPGPGIVREGEGVYERTRTLYGSLSMRPLGFIVPWPFGEA